MILIDFSTKPALYLYCDMGVISLGSLAITAPTPISAAQGAIGVSRQNVCPWPGSVRAFAISKPCIGISPRRRFTKKRSAAAKAMSPRTARWWSCTGQHTGRSAADKFVVRDAQTERQVWWDNNKAMTPGAFRRALCRHDGLCRRPRAVRQGPVRRRRSHPSHHRAHRHRICLAFAVRASASDPPDAEAAQGLRSGIHHHRSAQLQRRSGQAWLRQRRP